MSTYYTKYHPDNDTGAKVKGLECCAIGEARLIDSDDSLEVKHFIKQAIFDKRTWLIFAFVKEYQETNQYGNGKEKEQEVKALHNVTYLGEMKNPRTNRHVRTYIVNLRQEF